ncbi:MAG TPA: ABC transporter permease [Thermoanaerobaculia bacterium]|nr:ABC transporter permease [Thermoanaerobaculia bacterium]
MIRILTENEMLKVFRRRRFRVVVLILVALTAMFAYGSWRSRQREMARYGPRDWRGETQRRIVEMQNQLRSRQLPDSYRRWMTFETSRLQYSLDHGFDPNAATGPFFSRHFIVAASFLLLPLLVTLFASDLVSSELSEGTIKVLLTRPVRRERILASKALALFACITITVVLAAVVSYIFGSIAFGFRGWGAPTLTGFQPSASGLDVSAVRQVPLWQDAIRVYGLGWYAAIVVGAVSLLLSVIFRTTAAAMGTMLAVLIAGTILPRFATGWDFAKYLFPTNLPLPDYYSGTPPPIPGMTVGSSVVNLAVWGAAALVAAFVVFTRRDVRV